MLIVFVGLSGSGKTTAANFFQGKKINLEINDNLLNNHITLPKCITTTTRAPRNNEINGIDYYFLSKNEFYKKLSNNKFIESASVFNNLYGLEMEEYNKYNNSIIVYDPQGARTIKEKINDVVLIYFDIPSEISLDRMINKRKDTDEDNMKKRMKEIQYFLDFKNECDYIIDGTQDINIILKQLDDIINENIKKDIK